MMVILNGKLVPEEEAKIPLMDRGLLFGDGLFETVRIHQGRFLFWKEHWSRFEKGASALGLALPVLKEEALSQALQLVKSNQVMEGALRYTLTRGTGGTGYSTKGMLPGSWFMYVRPAPPWKTLLQWHVIVSSYRFASGPFSEVKNSNRLLQVMSRMEADAAHCDEALLLNSADEVLEGASSNFFIFRGPELWTPPIGAGVLPGITREVVIGCAAALGVLLREECVTLDTLRKEGGGFFTNSIAGMAEMVTLDGKELPRSPLLSRFRDTFFKTSQEIG